MLPFAPLADAHLGYVSVALLEILAWQIDVPGHRPVAACAASPSDRHRLAPVAEVVAHAYLGPGRVEALVHLGDGVSVAVAEPEHAGADVAAAVGDEVPEAAHVPGHVMIVDPLVLGGRVRDRREVAARQHPGPDELHDDVNDARLSGRDADDVAVDARHDGAVDLLDRLDPRREQDRDHQGRGDGLDLPDDRRGDGRVDDAGDSR
ncbi:hypothetical protein HIM_11884 [Hirsutella minnesotensis 3608]|uniref:Uncharacterized protein n=1 Tax=Hirsutella minnesotensis 3608 TaxID=1043627 RepID=A0A0F7ZWC5_9HYPO|nr:hypothetical protein HIM_11884 [Hirsutella minnesotensis 3608]